MAIKFVFKLFSSEFSLPAAKVVSKSAVRSTSTLSGTTTLSAGDAVKILVASDYVQSTYGFAEKFNISAVSPYTLVPCPSFAHQISSPNLYRQSVIGSSLACLTFAHQVRHYANPNVKREKERSVAKKVRIPSILCELKPGQSRLKVTKDGRKVWGDRKMNKASGQKKNKNNCFKKNKKNNGRKRKNKGRKKRAGKRKNKRAGRKRGSGRKKNNGTGRKR